MPLTAMQFALHRAPPGSVIVCVAGDTNWAMAGGNGCAWARYRGVAGLVIDGVIRDLAEVRSSGFPVFGRGLLPIAGKGLEPGRSGEPVHCGGVRVAPGDMVIADEDGIVVLPAEEAETLRAQAEQRAAREARVTLQEWADRSLAMVVEALRLPTPRPLALPDCRFAQPRKKGASLSRISSG